MIVTKQSYKQNKMNNTLKQEKELRFKKYQKLQKTLEDIKYNHSLKFENKMMGCDPTFIKVKIYADLRLKKQLGCEKTYDSWIFYSTATNDSGYELYEKIKNECKDFKLLLVTERQL